MSHCQGDSQRPGWRIVLGPCLSGQQNGLNLTIFIEVGQFVLEPVPLQLHNKVIRVFKGFMSIPGTQVLAAFWFERYNIMNTIEKVNMQTVQLFVTCLIDTLQPQIGEAVVEVLRKAGVEVAFPQDQTCCGQPAFNAGMRSQARKTAEHTIQVFEAAPGPVVIPSGSCAAMIRHSYLELFEDDPEWLQRAEALASRTYEFTEFLVDVLEVSDFGARHPGALTYHPSCHLLRGLGVDRQPRLLLSKVREAEIIELPHQDECCGFGGVFSVKHPEISAEMLKRKINNIEDTKAPTVVVCDTGCLMNIGGGLHRMGKHPKVMHIAEILNQV